MKQNHRRSRQRQQSIQLWTYSQAVGAVPYLRSIVSSLREHRLAGLSQHLTACRLAERPGRPNRSAIIAREEALREARLADERFQETLEELGILDVYCLDPVDGLAMVPFTHDRQLAWFIFDLHDTVPFRHWRYQEDPLETRRPIADALLDPPPAGEVA